jgi:hypothetical protein
MAQNPTSAKFFWTCPVAERDSAITQSLDLAIACPTEPRSLRSVFFFDVESTDLHGSAFGFGALFAHVHDDGTVEVIDSNKCFSRESHTKCSQWVRENVLPVLVGNITDDEWVNKDFEMRDRFWGFLQKCIKSNKNVEVWADVAWPVEAKFLLEVVNDGNGQRDFEGPYPLKDLSTLLPVGEDRIVYGGVEEKLGRVLRPHDPLDDCLASLYALNNVFMILRSK